MLWPAPIPAPPDHSACKMKLPLTLAFTTLLAVFSAPSLAIYKCTDSAGKPTFSDIP